MKVHEIFRSIQGEGTLTGVPMTFIRLYGCNLSCPWCDTPQGDYRELPVPDIVDIVAGCEAITDDWVCITGGEPTIHEELNDLTKALYRRDVKVAVETNGTNPLPGWCSWVCVSPKSIWPEVDVFVRADEIKLLVGSGMYDIEEAIKACRAMWIHGPYRVKPDAIVLQPVWDDNYEANLQRAIELCQKHQVRLSVQVHKLIGVK